MVTFDMPYSVSGITERNYHGTGLVVDAERGLVVVDRNTVPVSVGDVHDHLRRHRAGARAGGVHPPAAQPRGRRLRPEAHRHDAGEVREARRRASCSPASRVWVVGLGADSQLHSRSTEIASIDPLELPLSRTMRFRDSNIEVAQLVNPPLDFDGVLPEQVGQRARHCGRASPTRTAARSRRTTAACRSMWSPTCSIACARGKPLHSLEAELARAAAGERARARAVGGLGAEAWRSTTRRAARRCRRAPGRRLAGAARCCSRATCCSRSTARSSRASARSSGPPPTRTTCR